MHQQDEAGGKDEREQSRPKTFVSVQPGYDRMVDPKDDQQAKSMNGHRDCHKQSAPENFFKGNDVKLFHQKVVVLNMPATGLQVVKL